VTGKDATFNFSGWHGSLTEAERAVVEDRIPDGYDFEVALEWLQAERKYQTTKFNYEAEADRPVEYWVQQFDSYIQRMPLFGLDSPPGRPGNSKAGRNSVSI
jgi:hypothetical protein